MGGGEGRGGGGAGAAGLRRRRRRRRGLAFGSAGSGPAPITGWARRRGASARGLPSLPPPLPSPSPFPSPAAGLAAAAARHYARAGARAPSEQAHPPLRGRGALTLPAVGGRGEPSPAELSRIEPNRDPPRPVLRRHRLLRDDREVACLGPPTGNTEGRAGPPPRLVLLLRGKRGRWAPPRVCRRDGAYSRPPTSTEGAGGGCEEGPRARFPPTNAP